jgi:tetratricopeptide (TPR) repeat protein
MSKRILQVIVVLAVPAVVMTAQKAKSQKEVEAIQAVGNATTPDATISAVENLVSKFADTEFKSWAYNAAGDAAQRKRDNGKAIFYYEQAIKADAKNHMALLMLAGVLAQQTREFDLDKEEKLSQAEKYVKSAMALIPSAAKPNPQIPDAQWEGMKKDDMATAHIDLGLIANVRKKCDVAITEFKTAVDTANTPDAGAMVRLAGAYSDCSKSDDAVSTLNKVLGMQGLNPAVKQIAEAELKRLQTGKAAK